MRIRFQPWQLAFLVVLLCGAVVGIARWRRLAQVYDAPTLLATLPIDRATLVYIDAGLLRTSGILDLLAGSKAAEEQDYRGFVEQTGFDYRTDLDAVAAAFVDDNVYIALRGRFDWKALSGYARTQGGSCQYTLCTMPGSSANRNISFYPLKRDVLAVAISAEPRAVNMISRNQPKQLPPLPPEPVWISVPAAALADSKVLPEVAQPLLSPLARAQKVIFAIGPQGDRLQLRLEVACPSPELATKLTGELASATDLFKKMSAQQHKNPDPRELTGILLAGTFQQNQSEVTGKWPVERSFLEALASGGLQ